MSSSKTEKPVIPGSIKVSELAKQLGIKSTILLEKAVALGIKNLKSHASTLNAGQVDRLKAKLGKKEELQAELEENKTRLSKRTKANKTTKGVEDEEGAAGAHADSEPQYQHQPVESGSAAEELAFAPEPAAPPEIEAVEQPEPLPVEEAPPEVVAAPEVEEAPAPAVESGEVPAVEAVATTPAEVKVKYEAPPSRFGVVSAAPPPPVQKSAPTVKAAPPVPAKAIAPPPRPEMKSPVPPPLSHAPKRVLSGPEVAPPIQRGQKVDPRFGVVTPAPLEQPKPAAQARTSVRGKTATGVESKPTNDFKPQVSYPSVPESYGGGSEEDKRRGLRTSTGQGGGQSGGAGAGPQRRGPMRGGPGLKGFSSGPRRGVALMRGDDDRFRGARRPKHRMIPAPTVKREGPADVTSPVTIKALCEALGIKAAALIRKFFEQGKTVTINSILPEQDAELYALEFDPLKFGIVIKKARDVEEELLKKAEIADKPGDMMPRAPVVTIMGHVDHGKTSLLDHIRQTKVAAGEAGGITQHIGAYKVHHTKGDVTFLDTPGHKAFTEMRARGANVTDVVVLVVAANDGVMPQTEEAISHARQAGKKIVVALNKIDLPDATPDRVKGQLASKELFVEGYGGEVGCVHVSAKTGQGIDELLDRILLEAEVLELKANPDKHAVGTVVEAHKDQGRGIVCTLLVQEGTLKQGDVIICGHAYGSVRQIFADTGKLLKEAKPSTPVLVTGLSDVPLSGERFHVLESIKEAAEIADQRAMRMRQEGLIKRAHVTLETLSDLLKLGAVASLKLVLKVDVMGSLAPLRNEISKLSREDARIDILHDAVGAINETDVLLADASDAIVIGFNVTADPGARRLAEERKVDLRTYTIIYEVVDEMTQALEGMLKPIERESIQGHGTIRQTFKISKVGTIAGMMVTDGLITRNSSIRLVRDGKPVWTGKLASLKRVKDDAKEVRAGFECGIKLESFDDVKQGDVVEAFTIEQVKRTLETK